MVTKAKIGVLGGIFATILSAIGFSNHLGYQRGLNDLKNQPPLIQSLQERAKNEYTFHNQWKRDYKVIKDGKVVGEGASFNNYDNLWDNIDDLTKALHSSRQDKLIEWGKNAIDDDYAHKFGSLTNFLSERKEDKSIFPIAKKLIDYAKKTNDLDAAADITLSMDWTDDSLAEKIGKNADKAIVEGHNYRIEDLYHTAAKLASNQGLKNKYLKSTIERVLSYVDPTFTSFRTAYDASISLGESGQYTPELKRKFATGIEKFEQKGDKIDWKSERYSWDDKAEKYAIAIALAYYIGDDNTAERLKIKLENLLKDVKKSDDPQRLVIIEEFSRVLIYSHNKKAEDIGQMLYDFKYKLEKQ